MYRLHNAGRALLDRYRSLEWDRDSISRLLVSRIIFVIPLAITSISFVLATISLFAGIQKGSLQDFDVLKIDTSQLGHNLVSTIFDAVSFNATELGQELSRSAVRDNTASLQGSLGPRALVSEDEFPETIHISVPRQLIGDLLNLTGTAVQSPAAIVPNLLTPSQPTESSQRQTSVTQTQQDQSTTQAQAQPTTQQEQNPRATPQPDTTTSNGAAPTESPARGALGAGVPDQNNAALFRVAQTVFDNVKGVVKANAVVVGNGAAGVITGELRAADQYSLHVSGLCREELEPQRGSPGLKTTFCDGRPASRLDPVKDLARKPLVLGPVTVDLGKTSLPEVIDNLVDIANGVLLIIFLLYLASMLLTLLAVGTVLGSLYFELSQAVTIVNLGVTTAATISSFLSSLATTIVTVTLVHYLNKVGVSVGFSAAQGGKFLALTWATTATLLLGTGFWIGHLTFLRVSSALRRKRFWEQNKFDW